jgi:hypothetical protein
MCQLCYQMYYLYHKLIALEYTSLILLIIFPVFFSFYRLDRKYIEKPIKEPPRTVITRTNLTTNHQTVHSSSTQQSNKVRKPAKGSRSLLSTIIKSKGSCVPKLS